MNQVALLLFLPIFFITGLAYGASGEGIPWSLVGPQTLNFSLFVLLLVYLLRKRVRDLFTQRKRDYNQLFHQAEMEREAAEKKKSEILQKLKTLKEESQEALEKAQLEAGELKKKILSEAHSVSDRFSKESERTVQYELNKAKLELRGELLVGSLKSAEAHLREKVDTSTQEKLNKEFTDKVQVICQ